MVLCTVPDVCTHENPRVIRESPQRLVQRLVHLLAGALEEPAAACLRSETVSFGALSPKAYLREREYPP
jgi:hypothetical protein